MPFQIKAPKYLLTDKYKLKLLNHIYVAHPDSDRILERIKRCHNSRSKSEVPMCMILTANTGAGKSTLIKRYMAEHPVSETTKRTIVPIFSSVIPSNTTIPQFIQEILKSLIRSVISIDDNTEIEEEIEKMASGGLQAIKARLYKYLEKAQVQMIILDEFQHLIHDSNKKILNDVANTIKTLILETKIPVVLVGTPKALAVLPENSEMARRFTKPMMIKPFSITNDEDINLFRTFLATVDSLLPFKQRSNFASKELTIRFFAASNGYIDDIMRIIHYAGEDAIIDQSDHIKLHHLETAFDATPGQNHSAPDNPFSVTINNILTWKNIAKSHYVAGAGNRIKPKKPKSNINQILTTS